MGRRTAMRAEIEPFLVMEVVAEALEREAVAGDVLHLEVGQPSTGAPRSAIEAAMERLASGDALGYTPACGIAPLRSAVAALTSDRYGVDIDPDRVIITSGASGALVLALLAAFDPGAVVAIAEPGYPCHREIAATLGLEPIVVRVGPETSFLVTAETLERVAADRRDRREPAIDGIIVASPANPTGATYDRDGLAEVATWCDRHDVRLVSDEIYHGITFEHPAPSAAEFDVDAIVLGSFSKYFCMTGWRLGWMIVPASMTSAVDRLAQHLYLSPPTLAQHVALEALECADELDAHVRRYAANRSVLAPALASIGVRDLAPCTGAFYLYGRIDHWGLDSLELCRRWLHETGVAASPGIDFDRTDGGRWVRWSIAGSTADVAEAAERLARWAAQHDPGAAGTTMSGNAGTDA